MPHHRLTAAFTVLGVLVLGAVAWLVAGGDADPQPPGPAVSLEPAGLEDGSGTERRQEAVPVAVDADTVGRDGDEPFRIEFGVAEEPGDGRRLVVQVWDGQVGVPAAGAMVFRLEQDEVERDDGPYARWLSEIVEADGRSQETDSRGVVELAPVRGSCWLAARLPGRFAVTRVRADHAEVESLVLAVDETVTVRVVDEAGEPVEGVPVGVLQQLAEKRDPKQLGEQVARLRGQLQRGEAWLRDNPERARQAGGRIERARRELSDARRRLREVEEVRLRTGAPETEPVFVGREDVRGRRLTDADGLAVFRHFQFRREPRQGEWPAYLRDRFRATPLVPLVDGPSVEFAGRPVPEQVLELRMPPTGSVALRPVDAAGQPFTHPVEGRLRALDIDIPGWVRVPERRAQGEAELLFAHVGLGLRFAADLELDDDDFRWRAPEFDGPRTPGERVTIDVVVAPGVPMLTGRVVDVAGRPLRGIRPSFLITSPRGRLEGEEVPLGEDGRFHLPYQPRGHQPPYRLEVRREGVRPMVGCVLALDELPKSGLTDLGDLRLEVMPPIATGRVVDDRGEPLPGAVVRLQQRRAVGGDQPRERFVDEAFLEAEAGEDGSFELFGRLEPGDYRLRAECDGHFGVVSGRLGSDQPIELRLDRRSRLVGTVRVPEWLPRPNLRLKLVSLDDPRAVRDDQLRDYQGATYVYFADVRAGRYRVEFRVRDFPDPFLQIRELTVEPGQWDVHPLLRDLDLGAWIYRIEVDAVDDQGQGFNPDRPLLAQITRPDGSRPWVGLPWQNGHVDVLSTTPQVEVRPLASGRFAAPAVLSAGPNQLTFLRLPPLDLQLPGIRQIVGELPVRVVMELQGEEQLPGGLERWDDHSNRMAGWYRRARFATANLNVNDLARLRPASGGRFLVSLRLGDSGRGRGRGRDRGISVPLGEVSATLTPGDKPQRVTVPVDLAAVQQAFAELQARAQQGGGGR